MAPPPSASMLPADQALVKAIPGNDQCLECSTSAPSWCSVTYGTLLCLECAGRHRGLGVHLSFVRSLDMDSFTRPQLLAMKEGGNQACRDFFARYQETTKEMGEKYNSPTAHLYKQVILARVEGRPEPTELPKIAPQAAGKKKRNNTLSYANHAPPPSFVASYLVVLRLVWTALTYTHKSMALVSLSVLATASGWKWLAGPRGRKVLGWMGGGVLSCISLGCAHLAHQYRRERLPAFPTAVFDYTKRVNLGRAKRLPDIEIFFPPNVSIGDKVPIAMLFYPGALIDHMSYAKILGDVSDGGILVILVNAEPVRLTFPGIYVTKAQAISHMRTVQTLLGIDVGEWVMGGHSLGCFAAEKLALELPPTISRLVLWGAKFENARDWLKKKAVPAGSTSPQVLVLTADKDGISKPKSIRNNMSDEQRVSRIEIKGGNHSGFGHYGPQLFPVPDGEREISLDEQQRLVVKHTAHFLKQQQKAKCS